MTQSLIQPPLLLQARSSRQAPQPRGRRRTMTTRSRPCPCCSGTRGRLRTSTDRFPNSFSILCCAWWDEGLGMVAEGRKTWRVVFLIASPPSCLIECEKQSQAKERNEALCFPLLLTFMALCLRRDVTEISSLGSALLLSYDHTTVTEFGNRQVTIRVSYAQPQGSRVVLALKCRTLAQ